MEKNYNYIITSCVSSQINLHEAAELALKECLEFIKPLAGYMVQIETLESGTITGVINIHQPVSLQGTTLRVQIYKFQDHKVNKLKRVIPMCDILNIKTLDYYGEVHLKKDLHQDKQKKKVEFYE